jgi:hypothetical protein
VNTGKRNYDEELKVLLKIAEKNNFLNPSIFTSGIDEEQLISPVVYWIDNQTSIKEVTDANTRPYPEGN